MDKHEVIAKLEKRLEALKQLDATKYGDPSFKKWQRDTEVALEKIFGPDTRHLVDFSIVRFAPSSFHRGDPGPADARAFTAGRLTADALLLSMIGEVTEYWPDDSVKNESYSNALPTSSDKVFVVHGHDNAAKESVARLIGQLELEPIILHEKPNKGRTIIEKFVDYTDVGFAVVILTGDDRGGEKSESVDSYQDRARQNVILELGFFLGKLGRDRVCALYQDGVEIPSDYDGVLFVPLDGAGAWRYQLAKEMKAAGLDVDLNKL